MIYLDYAATTPVHERVLQAMHPYFSEEFGNPSSAHQYGQQAEHAVETARESVAAVLNCDPDEVVFTSCGSESDNLALRGAAYAARKQHQATWILSARTEHPAVSRTVNHLENDHGFKVEWLNVDEHGVVQPQVVEQAICDHTAVVSVMYANNEIGTINPIQEIARICRHRGVLFHTDAVQAAGYLDVDVRALGVDMVSLGSHKFYGPKGVGVLYIRGGTFLVPHLTGGEQELGRRSGTHNVPLIVGFAEALHLTHLEREMRTAHVKTMRDRLVEAVLEVIPDSRLTGHPNNRMPNHASFVFKNVDGNILLQMLDAEGFACSSGSACKVGNPEPSDVLDAIGISQQWNLGSLRVSLGVGTTPQHIDSLIAILPGLVEKNRKAVK